MYDGLPGEIPGPRVPAAALPALERLRRKAPRLGAGDRKSRNTQGFDAVVKASSVFDERIVKAVVS